MDEQDWNKQLAELDQYMSQLRESLAPGVAAFYKRLLEDGVPCDAALVLANTFLVQLFPRRTSTEG